MTPLHNTVAERANRSGLPVTPQTVELIDRFLREARQQPGGEDSKGLGSIHNGGIAP